VRRLAAVLILVPLAAAAQEADVPEETETIEIHESLPPPGSSQIVGKKELERFSRDDVGKALSAVPGVYVRQEDGYGLRPNIGMRGAASERSAKIVLMEDDVLIAPAPYSAPAAYYFPLMARMVSMEVTKGPSAIAYGPNTVGGALNLTTKMIPLERELALEVAGGTDLYGKLHASYGESWDDVGLLIEGVKLRSDGFKHLDGGGPTGFDKNDVMVKLKARAGASDLTLKAAYNDEVSHESYTGLADEDFAVDPYRRYAGTALDRFDAWHSQLVAGHLLSWPSGSLTTTAYRNDFSRRWRKLNGFRGRMDLAEILAHPESGNTAVYHAVLAGEQDSTSDAEALVLGTNARRFVSQGVQTALKQHSSLWGLPHTTELGLRLHHDSARRLHDEEAYRMTSGELQRDATPRMITLDATGSALALAAYARHQVRLGNLQLTAGVRTEMVWTRLEDHADPSHDSSASYGVIIPGGGVVWQPLPWLGLLAGVHRGFVPVAPGEQDGADPEESINYEAGARAGNGWWQAEAIGFFSDYSNLKGTCTFSEGCDTQHLEMEFNGGRVYIAGAEARASIAPRRGAWTFPASLAYTYSWSSFRSSFDSNNPAWGDIEIGDSLPYLPSHQLALSAGVRRGPVDVAAAARFVSAMRDVAGQGEVPAEERTQSTQVLDLAASLELPRWGRLYLTVDNLLDSASIVSRRPYGARPGVPRLVVVGYKQTF
jgi:Fe(3+) dicitrate transport protein